MMTVEHPESSLAKVTQPARELDSFHNNTNHDNTP
jgi:hypothetical protein